METLTEIPLRVMHVFETDDESVVEVELPATEPRFTVALDGRTLVVRVPRQREREHWHMNADVTGA